MWRILWHTSLVLFFLQAFLVGIGCRPREERKPPSEPVPQTKEEFKAQLQQILLPLRQIIPFSPDIPTPPLTDEIRQQVMFGLFEFMQKYGDNPQAQQASREVAQEVAQWARIAKERGRWNMALGCIDVFEMLGARSYALQRLREQGEKLLAQPKIAVRGFLEDKETKTLTIFVELVDRRTGKIKRAAVRVGDEIDNIRVVEVIPYKNTVRFEYIPIEGMFIDVEGPKF